MAKKTFVLGVFIQQDDIYTGYKCHKENELKRERKGPKPVRQAFKPLKSLATSSMSFTFHSPLQSFSFLLHSLLPHSVSTLMGISRNGGFVEPSKDAPRGDGVAIVGLGNVVKLCGLVVRCTSTGDPGSPDEDCEVVGAGAAGSKSNTEVVP